MPALPDNIDTEWPGWTLGVGNGNGDGEDSKIGQWSSLIGIITAIVGNVLIALALNVQRYSHVQLHKRRNEARERAKEATRRLQHNDGRNSYGSLGVSSEAYRGDGLDDDDNAPESRPLNPSFQSSDSGCTEGSEDDFKVSSNYLKSPSWWLGQFLMTVGEMGNFLAYGFAPASIVSPLGVVALISNCVIAPLFFGERFRKRDFWGVIIAVAGAVTVVLSAKQEETKLEPHDVWDAITTTAFEVYLGATIAFIIILMWASPRYGHRTILIDIGLVGLFGGYTALTTKGVSSMLSATLWRAFTTPVTYVLVAILLGTAIMQVRYVNKALQRFDSTQVIPVQFVLFTLSVIIGSAVLYGDFERTNTEQAIKFVGGCLLTFFGVFLITSGRQPRDEADELSDDEGVEETIGLRDQETPGSQGGKPVEYQQQSGSIRSSRRSSHASRISFADPVRPLSVQRNSGLLSFRRPDTATLKSPVHTPTESSPMLSNPWRNSTDERPPHPGLLPTFSDHSVVTMHSVTSANTDHIPSTTSLPPPIIEPPSPRQPTTPRQSFSSTRPHIHHFNNTFISPSPLSSTVSAVVSDALLRGEDSPIPRRKSLQRTRPSIRSSLFVSQDCGEDFNHSDPLLHRIAEPDTEAEDAGSGEHRGLKGRARSFSNTLGGLFGKKRRRRNTNPETGLVYNGSQESGLSSGSGIGSGSDEREERRTEP
ncbi:magnesium transporter NIPA-domain-containing protein [Pseudomassariella vexata]|uniref:Magnesium transporter NIPA-domain-containing protein n=1 Tax=Pseudomassariella vexata TaxID=1141098 RepID=A0A1Y2DWA8_9PEZI|nr:magnesium transporter NIPA-domain-containing protein [Pseudomassariella vexata]ORY63580.1 magnesium transporter NIPA-domain-containing protein [Pseudomassariella vexata]